MMILKFNSTFPGKFPGALLQTSSGSLLRLSSSRGRGHLCPPPWHTAPALLGSEEGTRGPRLGRAASTHRRGDSRGNLVTPAPSHRVAGKGGSRARPAHGCGERGLQAAESSPSRREKALDLCPEPTQDRSHTRLGLSGEKGQQGTLGKTKEDLARRAPRQPCVLSGGAGKLSKERNKERVKTEDRWGDGQIPKAALFVVLVLRQVEYLIVQLTPRDF